MQLKEFCNLSHDFYGLFLCILQTNGLTIGKINEKEQQEFTMQAAYVSC